MTAKMGKGKDQNRDDYVGLCDLLGELILEKEVLIPLVMKFK
jgi:hypothetical protein